MVSVEISSIRLHITRIYAIFHAREVHLRVTASYVAFSTFSRISPTS